MTLSHQWLFRKRTWVVAFAIAAGVLAWDRWGFPLLVPFRRDPDQPYRIELGRGSGMFGLHTVRVDQDGVVTLYRQGTEGDSGARLRYWETATLRLPADGRAAVLAAVADTRVLGLGREYHDPSIHDGTQWVLCVRQGGRERAVYCNNRFPPAVVRFAGRLDAVLAAHGLAAAEWTRVHAAEAGRHDRELWDSIHR